MFRKHLIGVDWQAIESGTTGLGIPDLNGCVGGVEFWIEMKATTSWRLRISPQQVGWAERRARSGGRVFLAARAIGKARDDLWLYSGRVIRGLVTQRLDQVPCLGHWSCGPAHWDWGQVRTLLTV